MKMQDKELGAEVRRRIIGRGLFAISSFFISKASPHFNFLELSLLVSSPVLGAN